MYKRLFCIVLIMVYLISSYIKIDINNSKQQFINVNIKGQVLKPGNYSLKLGSNLDDLLKQAKINDESDIRQLNLNRILYDNEYIYIPKKKKELISINNATFDQLVKLPGIGEITANRIIEYRNVYGPFINLEDIKFIYGIGDKKYEKLKEYICL